MNLQELNFWFGHWMELYNQSQDNSEQEQQALGAIKALYLVSFRSPDQDVREYCRKDIARWWDETMLIHGQPEIIDCSVFPSIKAFEGVRHV